LPYQWILTSAHSVELHTAGMRICGSLGILDSVYADRILISSPDGVNE
jgi:hypothetical protein